MYGYPFGLDFTRGYPRYNPGEFTTVDVLREKDVDAAFVICSDLLNQIPADCAAYLAEIPLIYMDTIPCPTIVASDVVLPGVIDAMNVMELFTGSMTCLYTLNLSRVHLSRSRKVTKIP